MVLWGLAGGCATYENTTPDTNGVVGGGGAEASSSGSGGAEVAGSAGSSVGGATSGAPTAGMAGRGGAAGGVAGSSAGSAGTPSGGAAGTGGAGQAGSGGVAGAGGGGGKAGSGGSGGNGGAGGSVAVQTCAKNPLSMKSKWVVTASASSNADPTTNAHDGVLTNRWTTGKEQAGNEWLQVDFGAVVTLTKVTLVLGASVNDYPRKYATRFSNTSMNQAAPVLISGMGAASADTVLTFPKGTSGRYLLITQSGVAPALWWSVAEIQAECAD